MKILQTPARFYPFIGGVENYALGLSRELIKLGHDVTVLCANEPLKSESEDIIENVKVKRLNYVGKIANTNITLKLPFQILKEDFDILHTHLPTPWSADWSAFASRIKNKPLILTYHNDIQGEGFSSFIAKIYNKTLLKFVLNTARKIIITQPNYIDFSPHLETYKNKIRVIPPGVDIEKFKQINVKKVENSICFLSLLDKYHKYKGLDFLLKAIRKVKKEIPDVKLIVGGSGKLLGYYKEMANSLSLEKNTEFLGFIPSEKKLVEFYNQSCLFVLPSTSQEQEGFGMVALEALSCGIPVIATDVVGIAEEIKRNKIGRIVKPRDENSLANAMIEILQEDKERMGKMGESGRKLVEEKYSWEKIAKRVESLYRRVV